MLWDTSRVLPNTPATSPSDQGSNAFESVPLLQQTSTAVDHDAVVPPQPAASYLNAICSALEGPGLTAGSLTLTRGLNTHTSSF